MKFVYCTEKRRLIFISITQVSYLLNYVSKPVLEFEMMTYRPVQLYLYLSSKHSGCIKAILSQAIKIAP